MSNTINDVAQRAGVSPSTVSRVLNKTGYVSAATREKVECAAKELDYSPSILAAGLSRNRMNTIGVIVPDICNSFFSEVFYAASKVAEQHNYRLLLCNADESIEREASAIQDMMSYRLSGIIITPISDKDGTNTELLKTVQRSGIPIVFVDREMRNMNCDGVYIDNVRGAYEATSLLLDQGHKKIAIIAGPQDTIPGRDRMRGYVDALADRGITPHPDHVVMADFRSDSSYEATMRLLESPRQPTAFFTCNNLMTLGCLRALSSKGKKIPNDYAMVGFDDVDMLNLMGYQLTTVSRATTEMGRIAMRLLLDRMDENNSLPYQRVVLQSHLQVRGSEVLSR